MRPVGEQEGSKVCVVAFGSCYLMAIWRSASGKVSCGAAAAGGSGPRQSGGHGKVGRASRSHGTGGGASGR